MGVLYAKVSGAWEPILSGALDLDAADARYVNIPGDTMTGPLVMNTAADQAIVIKRAGGAPAAQGPHIAFQDAAGTRLGYLRFGTTSDTAPGARLAADNNQPIRFYTGGDQFVITTTEVTCNNKMTVVGPAGESQKIVGGTTGYIGFYEGSTRRCFVGHYPAGSTSVKADTGHLYLGTQNASYHTYLDSGSGYILFRDGTTEMARFQPSWFLLYKTAPDESLVGHMFQNQYQISSNNIGQTPCIVANKVGAGVSSGHDYIHFRTNGSAIGSITRNGSASGVLYNTTSDYRLKDDHGLITDALERIRALRARRVVWRDDPTQAEVDGFFAHEVAEVVPDAVTGDKDAVAEVDDEGAGHRAGEIVPQQLDPSRLIPLLVAAVQELAAELALLTTGGTA